MNKAEQMQLTKCLQLTEPVTLQHCIARVIQQNPVYATDGKHDDYLYQDVCRQFAPLHKDNASNVIAELPRMDSVLRLARKVRRLRKLRNQLSQS